MDHNVCLDFGVILGTYNETLLWYKNSNSLVPLKFIKSTIHYTELMILKTRTHLSKLIPHHQ